MWLASVSSAGNHRDNHRVASLRCHDCHENVATRQSTRRDKRTYADVRRAKQTALAVDMPFVLIRQELQRVRCGRHFPVTVWNRRRLGTAKQVSRVDEYPRF